MYEVSQLVDIKKQLENGDKVIPVTVRTFLSWFNAYRRGWYVVEEIYKTLDRYNIETVPNFNHLYIDAYIEFRLKSSNSQEGDETISSTTTSTTTKPPENISLTDGDDILNFNDPTYRIGKLEAANRDLTYVNPDSELTEAITKMITFDFSQLPVMQQAKRGLKGVISWRSIGTKLAFGQTSTKVRDLMEANYQLITSETSLFKALQTIIEHDYVLVENSSKEVCGIVTASDLSLQFKQLTEPFLLVSEIENHVRHLLSKLPKIDIENAKDEKDRERIITNVSDLTFGEYLRLFQNPDTWKKTGLKIDRKTFCEHLEIIRDIRNNIMHFDPDGLEEEAIEALRRFARLLQTIRSTSTV